MLVFRAESEGFMVVSFVGHREVADEPQVHRWLEETVNELILEGADTFYLGGYGRFDRLAHDVVWKAKAQHPQIHSFLMIPYLNRSYDTSRYDGTIYPPLEQIPQRLAIVKRNEYMVDRSDVVVAYVLYSFGGAAQTLRYAIRRKKRILRFEPEKSCSICISN